METVDQSDEETCPDHQKDDDKDKDNSKDKTILKTSLKSDPDWMTKVGPIKPTCYLSLLRYCSWNQISKGPSSAQKSIEWVNLIYPKFRISIRT